MISLVSQITAKSSLLIENVCQLKWFLGDKTNQREELNTASWLTEYYGPNTKGEIREQHEDLAICGNYDNQSK